MNGDSKNKKITKEVYKTLSHFLCSNMHPSDWA